MARNEDLNVSKLNVRQITAFPEDTAASVTQASNRSTGVIANGIQGTIVTNAASLAAGVEATFTVTNNKVKADSVVNVSLKTKSATAVSFPFVSATAAGSFDITMSNLDGTTADTSASTILFFVLNGTPT